MGQLESLMKLRQELGTLIALERKSLQGADGAVGSKAWISRAQQRDTQFERVRLLMGEFFGFITPVPVDKNDSKYQSYLNSPHGQALKEQHPFWNTVTGYWAVFGEDTNPDFHGNHVEPYLGTFQGYLDDVVRMAVNLPLFYHGKIMKQEIKKV